MLACWLADWLAGKTDSGREAQHESISWLLSVRKSSILRVLGFYFGDFGVHCGVIGIHRGHLGVHFGDLRGHTRDF